MKKALISLSICAGCLVISFGLCGLGVLHSNNNSTSDNVAMAGLAGFVLSAVGIAISLIWLLIAAIRDGSRR